MRLLYRRVPGLQKAVRAALYLFREFLVIGMTKRRRFLKPVGKLAQRAPAQAGPRPQAARGADARTTRSAASAS